jgi:ribosomal protein L11 methyltransferase
MNPPRNPQPKSAKGNSCPYGDLYIYYLQGKLKPEQDIFKDNFIGNWEEENFSFLFFSNPARSEVAKLVHSQPQLTYIDSYHMSYDQWLGERFTAFNHGKFCIIPAWDSSPQYRLTSEEIKILMDPGVVFGTGTHPTTCDCLDALELATATMPPETVLDLGTGTGLLALAAAQSGCRKIIAVDLNLLAAKTAIKNVYLNRLEKQVLVARGKAQDFIGYPANLVIANIHFDVMQEVIASEGFLQKEKFILSGLLRSEAKAVTTKLAQYPVKLIKTWTSDGIWHTIYGRRNKKNERPTSNIERPTSNV